MTTLGIIFLSILCLGIIVMFILIDNGIIDFDIGTSVFIIFFIVMFTLTMIAEYDNLTSSMGHISQTITQYMYFQ